MNYLLYSSDTRKIKRFKEFKESHNLRDYWNSDIESFVFIIDKELATYIKILYPDIILLPESLLK